jgi:hypothetical protein
LKSRSVGRREVEPRDGGCRGSIVHVPVHAVETVGVEGRGRVFRRRFWVGLIGHVGW